jgi:PPK2 family polyphosphate:nucleotide phosphotransferase
MPDVQDIIERCRVPAGKSISLADYDPAWAGDNKIPKAQRKQFAEELLTQDVSTLTQAQELLYASDTWSVLIIFQALDAAGKDGTIKHVMSGVNPQGVQVYSFKHPSSEELDHNFLWRCMKALPERGRIGIFNRSYYEDVLIVKVHPELLAAQRIPDSLEHKDIWKERYEDINAFERHLSRNGTRILKFFLNVSYEEQRERFLKRLNDPAKHWKFSAGDLAERAYWRDYQRAYEEALSRTSTDHAPWYVIPADHKWVTRAIVANIIVDAIHKLKLEYPQIDDKQRAQIDLARKQLEAEEE